MTWKELRTLENLAGLEDYPARTFRGCEAFYKVTHEQQEISVYRYKRLLYKDTTTNVSHHASE